MLTRALAKAFAPETTVNSVAPGVIPFGGLDPEAEAMGPGNAGETAGDGGRSRRKLNPQIHSGVSEMVTVSRFVENAVKLMDAAETAVLSGHTPSHVTILIGCEGGMRMIADSDWPLDSLHPSRGLDGLPRQPAIREGPRGRP